MPSNTFTLIGLSGSPEGDFGTVDAAWDWATRVGHHRPSQVVILGADGAVDLKARRAAAGDPTLRDLAHR